MKDNFKLEDREKFIAGLIIANGGKITYEKLVNIILRVKGPFYGLDKKYVRYKLIRGMISGLVSKNFIDETEREIYTVPEFVKNKFTESYPKDLLAILSVFSQYRNLYHLEFDLAEIEEGILDPRWYKIIPYGVVEQIQQAIEIYKKTSSYDSVITKCGKVMEILVREVNKKYKLVDENKPITEIIAEFKNQDIINKIQSQKDREAFRIFAYSAYLIYKYRSKMGAHIDWWWGMNQVAMSCLLLTFYVVDLFSLDLQHMEM